MKNNNNKINSKLLIILINLIFFISGVCWADEAQVSVNGDKNIVIGEQKGQVYVSYTLPKSSKPNFRVYYYRMGGAAPNFLIEGQLDTKWRELLGGNTPIITNPVLNEAQHFLNNFSSEIDAEIIEEDSVLLKKDSEENISLSVEDYTKNFGNKSKKLKAYLGAVDDTSFWYFDDKTIKTLLNTNDWPEGYKISSKIMELSKIETIDSPEIWRYLTKEDLEKGKSNGVLTEFENINDSKFDKNKFLKSLKYLAKKGIPPGFMISRGPFIGDVCGGYRFAFESAARRFEIVIAVVENVGADTIKIGKIGYKQMLDSRLRLPAETENELDSAELKREELFIPEQLKPNEKFIIPIRLQLANSDSLNSSNDLFNEDSSEEGPLDADSLPLNSVDKVSQSEIGSANSKLETDKTTKFDDKFIQIQWAPKDLIEQMLENDKSASDHAKLDLEEHNKNQELISRYKGWTEKQFQTLSKEQLDDFEMAKEFEKYYSDSEYTEHTYEIRSNTDKSRSLIPPPEHPEILDRFDFGPAWLPVDIEIEGTTFPFREYNLNKFVLVSGFQGGSCPFLYRYVKDGNFWVNEGPILVGASDLTKKRSEERELTDFNGILRITEQEAETSYLDEVHLRVVDAEKREQIIRTSDRSLHSLDGKVVVLRRGQSKIIDFTEQEKMWFHNRVFLNVSGHYIPWRDSRSKKK